MCFSLRNVLRGVLPPKAQRYPNSEGVGIPTLRQPGATAELRSNGQTSVSPRAPFLAGGPCSSARREAGRAPPGAARAASGTKFCLRVRHNAGAGSTSLCALVVFVGGGYHNEKLDSVNLIEIDGDYQN